MDSLVAYDLTDGVATLTLDDGKVNAISTPLLAAVNGALDQAEAAEAAVVLAGRPGVYSAGFDLKTLAGGGVEAEELTRGGFALVSRLLTFPRPVVAACTGHAIALGALVLHAADYRFGASGNFKLTMNEVAIGVPLPAAAIAILRERLHPSVHYRATVLAEAFTPDDAVATGWLDRVVEPAELVSAAREHASSLASLDRAAYHATKLLARRSLLDTFAHFAADQFVPRPVA